jgi:hypothetical protein
MKLFAYATPQSSDRQPMVYRPLMVREKMFVVRGGIWTLFAIFMCIILFHYIIMLFKTSSNKYHTNNFVIIKQVHFIILIKWDFYDHYFIDVCTS